MTVQRILKEKSAELITCRSENLIETVALILSTNKIGALPVCDGGRQIVGILSERDIVRGMAKEGSAVVSKKVKDLMTKKVLVCKSTDSIKDAMEIMSKSHIRHLPVVDENEQLIGIISQRDVMAERLQAAQLEKEVLRERVIVSGAL